MPRYLLTERRVATIEAGEGGVGWAASVSAESGVETIKLWNCCLSVNMTAKRFLTERHFELRPIRSALGRGLVNILIHKLVVNLFK